MIRRLTVALAVAGLLGASAALAHDAERQSELIDELLRLNNEAVPERIIIKQIQAWCFRFELDGDDIVELHTMGVSDDIIEALIDTAFDDLDCEPDDYEYVWYRAVYSPWWSFPYVWGCYWWNPWPVYYVHHGYYYPYCYYPSYGWGPGYYDGYYGWHGSDYYVAYNPRKRPPTPEPSGGSQLSVARGVPAMPAGAGATVTSPSGGGAAGGGRGVLPNAAGSSARTAQDHIATRTSPTLTPHTGGATATRGTPQERDSEARLRPSDNVVTPRALPAQPAAQPRSNPSLERADGGQRAAPRTAAPVPRETGSSAPTRPRQLETRLKSPRVTPSQPAERAETGAQKRVTPAQPAQRVERGAKSRPKSITPSAQRPAERAPKSRPKSITPSTRQRAESATSRSSKYSSPSRAKNQAASRLGKSKSGSQSSSKGSQVKSSSRSKSSANKSQVRPSSRSSRSSVSTSRPSRSSRSSVSRPSRSRSSVSRPSRSGSRGAAASRGRSGGSRGRGR